MPKYIYICINIDLFLFKYATFYKGIKHHTFEYCLYHFELIVRFVFVLFFALYWI